MTETPATRSMPTEAMYERVNAYVPTEKADVELILDRVAEVTGYRETFDYFCDPDLVDEEEGDPHGFDPTDFGSWLIMVWNYLLFKRCAGTITPTEQHLLANWIDPFMGDSDAESWGM